MESNGVGYEYWRIGKLAIYLNAAATVFGIIFGLLRAIDFFARASSIDDALYNAWLPLWWSLTEYLMVAAGVMLVLVSVLPLFKQVSRRFRGQVAVSWLFTVPWMTVLYIDYLVG
ncbi:hypothetical protein GGR27_000389 [Lewinella antarctica]|uniref:Uncharacterized protein n=1 Tax=Neolewinella antarctica TaxID=442734 RepID=A0ABX0X6S6_9BACT|nr:hypothetical protein [Neolewinella antarctica]